MPGIEVRSIGGSDVTNSTRMRNSRDPAGMTTAEAELKSLMRASQDGDAASHRGLLERLSSHLRAYYKSRLTKIGRGATEAEDLVQEAVLAIHIQRHTYDPEKPFTPWMHAIARYKFINFLRRTRASLADVPIDGRNHCA